MFLKNRNISSKIKRSNVTDYAALTVFVLFYFSCSFFSSSLKLFIRSFFLKSSLKVKFSIVNRIKGNLHHLNMINIKLRVNKILNLLGNTE